MDTKKILIVCNDLDAILISKILIQEYEVDVVYDQKDIAKCLLSHRYDLLLMDIAFCKTGSRTLQLIRQSHIPFVLLSSEPGDKYGEKLAETGCLACYIKPILQSKFKTFIRQWVNYNYEK